MSLVTRGLTKVEFAEILPDGGTGTTWFRLGDTAKGTAKFTQQDGTKTEIPIEESDNPIDVITTKGAKEFNLSVANPDADSLLKCCGGTVDAGPPKVWNEPDDAPDIELSMKITPKKGFIITAPRVKVEGKHNGSFTKDDVYKVDVVCTVLQPTKAGLKSVSFTEPVA